MNTAEQVTTFSLTGATYGTLVRALTEHLHQQGLDADGESHYCVNPSVAYGRETPLGNNTPLPTNFRWLVSYAVEGDNEGYYCHIGAIKGPQYTDIGFCKTFDAASAYKIATEAQRFLTAAGWN